MGIARIRNCLQLLAQTSFFIDQQESNALLRATSRAYTFKRSEQESSTKLP